MPARILPRVVFLLWVIPQSLLCLPADTIWTSWNSGQVRFIVLSPDESQIAVGNGNTVIIDPSSGRTKYELQGGGSPHFSNTEPLMFVYTEADSSVHVYDTQQFQLKRTFRVYNGSNVFSDDLSYDGKYYVCTVSDERPPGNPAVPHIYGYNVYDTQTGALVESYSVASDTTMYNSSLAVACFINRENDIFIATNGGNRIDSTATWKSIVKAIGKPGVLYTLPPCFHAMSISSKQMLFLWVPDTLAHYMLFDTEEKRLLGEVIDYNDVDRYVPFVSGNRDAGIIGIARSHVNNASQIRSLDLQKVIYSTNYGYGFTAAAVMSDSSLVVGAGIATLLFRKPTLTDVVTESRSILMSYPLPSSGLLRVDYTSAGTATPEVVVSNITTQKVLAQESYGVHLEPRALLLDFSRLAPGTYYVQVTDQTSIEHFKVIVAR